VKNRFQTLQLKKIDLHRYGTADDEQTWRDTPYITGVLRRYADRV
jgi:hypothetical protein